MHISQSMLYKGDSFVTSVYSGLRLTKTLYLKLHKKLNHFLFTTKVPLSGLRQMGYGSMTFGQAFGFSNFEQELHMW